MKILLVFYHSLITELEHSDPNKIIISFNLDPLSNITLIFGKSFSRCDLPVKSLEGEFTEQFGAGHTERFSIIWSLLHAKGSVFVTWELV